MVDRALDIRLNTLTQYKKFLKTYKMTHLKLIAQALGKERDNQSYFGPTTAKIGTLLLSIN